MAVVTAVITASVAVVVAAYGQFETWRRERAAREYERRRDALIGVQEAALDLRRELRRYGRALQAAVAENKEQVGVQTPVLVSPDVPSDHMDDATAVLGVRVTRLERKPESEAVRAAADTWAATAREHFLSPQDETAGSESSAWDDMNEKVNTALSS